ncbi:MAG: transcriptional regulator [Acidobacteria bacterium]|nr:transcriptional regulator [Acidobacteriota bacterium]
MSGAVRQNVYLRALKRITDIHLEIAKGKFPSVATLAEKMGVSIRTIKRDLSMLKNEFGGPIIYDYVKKGFCYTTPGWSLPLQPITEGDLLAFFIAEHALRFTGKTAEAVQLAATFTKLASMFPQELSVDLATLSDNTSFQDLPNVAADPKFLERLARAAMAQETVAFDYFSPHTGKHSKRTADIHLLHNFAGDWYAISFDHKAKDFRDFHVGRISNLALTGRTFEKQRKWDRDRYLSRGFFMTRGGRSTTVSIVFDSYQAQWMRERGAFHPTESREELPDGRLRLVFKTGENGLEAVARFCLTYAGNCTAEKPKKLRDLIAAKAQKACELHRHAVDGRASR